MRKGYDDSMSDVSQLDLRRERAAKNESVFREVNERVNELAEPASFICLRASARTEAVPRRS